MAVKVGLVGLGAMGLPMGRQLLRHGFDLLVVPHTNMAPAQELAALQWADELGAPTFGGSLAQQLYKLARTDETARLDYSVVARVYEEAAGVELRVGKPEKAQKASEEDK